LAVAVVLDIMQDQAAELVELYMVLLLLLQELHTQLP
jgi:hypothetical protein